jgi:very-short-patch-repair endonuclease
VRNILQVTERGDRGVAQLAAAQRGIAHRDQLAGVGVGRGAVDWRLSRSRMHHVFPRVVAIGNPVLEPLGAETAALLYARDGSFLSHDTAAALWGIAPADPGRVHLTTIGRRVRARPGLQCHRVAAIDLRDLRLHRGFPVTAPARTLVDLSEDRGPDELARALNEARVLGLLSDESLQGALDRFNGPSGTKQLRALLAAERGPVLSRSELERRFRALIDQGQLPQPQYNVSLLGYEVDVLWPLERLVVETDGFAVHGQRRAFEADRRRDQRLTAAGYTVIRVTYRQLIEEPLVVLVTVAQALAVARSTHRAT